MYVVPHDQDSYQSINQPLLWLSGLNAGWSVWATQQQLAQIDLLWVGILLAGYTGLLAWLRTQSFQRRRLVIDGLLIVLSIALGLVGTVVFVQITSISGAVWPWLRQMGLVVGLLLWQQWRMISTQSA